MTISPGHFNKPNVVPVILANKYSLHINKTNELLQDQTNLDKLSHFLHVDVLETSQHFSQFLKELYRYILYTKFKITSKFWQMMICVKRS